MFGRTTATVVMLLACQLASGCCLCFRPFFCCHRPFCGGGWGGGWGGGCCGDPCTACYNPGMPAATLAPPVAPLPVYNTVPVMPGPATVTPPATPPAANPPIDRIPPVSAAVPTGLRR